jgi:hypothetical protein
VNDAGEISIAIAEDAFESERALLTTIAHEYTHALQYSQALAEGFELSADVVVASESRTIACEAPAWLAFLSGFHFFKKRLWQR